MPSTRLLMVAPAIAPEDFSIWDIGQESSTVTNKFRDVVGPVTPCAPFGKLSADRGAHLPRRCASTAGGVTRPTHTLHDVTKVICRGTSRGARLQSPTPI